MAKETTPTRSVETPPAEPSTVTVTRDAPPASDGGQDRNADVVRMLELGRQYQNPALAEEYIRKGRSSQELLDGLFQWRSSGDPMRDQPGADDVGLSQRETSGYSLIRAINYLMDPDNPDAREAAAFEIEASAAARKKLAERGMKYSPTNSRSILVPREVQRRTFGDMLSSNPAVRDLQVEALTRRYMEGQRLTLQSTGVGTGAELVQTDVLGGDMIDILRAKMPIGPRLRVMRDVINNIAIPRKTASSGLAHTATENAAAADAVVAFEQVPASPKRLSAKIEVSRQLLIQGSPDAEMLVGDDLMAQARTQVESTIYNGAGSGGVPEGVRNTTGVAVVPLSSAPPTHGHIVDMESAIANADADMGDLMYVTTPGIRGVLKQTATQSGSGIFVWPQSESVLNGYPAASTTLMPSTLGGGAEHGILFGNWQDVVLIFWSVMELTVDSESYAQAQKFAAGIVFNQLWDMIVRHGTSFAKTDDATLT